MQSGKVVLERVHFIRVETLRDAAMGAVIFIQENCRTCELSYKEGSVQYLNSKLQYLPGAKGSPFLYAQSFYSLEIVHVSFKFNTVIDAYSSVLTPSAFALLFFGNFYQATVSHCEFHNNFVSGGLIVIDSSVQLSRTPDTSNTAYQFLATHIDLQQLRFQWNLGEHCLIGIRFVGDVQNVRLSDAEFIENAIEGDNFLHFESQAPALNALAFGAVEDVTSSSGMKGSVWVPPRTFELHNIEIRNIYAFNTLVLIHNLANINISQFSISDSGDFDADALPHAFASCCSAATVPSLPAAPICYSLLWTDGCVLVTLFSLQIRRNQCSQSSTALITSTSQGLLKVSHFTAESNFGFSESGLVLGIKGEEDFEGEFLVFRNNTNRSGPNAFFNTLKKIKLSHCLFEDNTGVYGGIFHFFAMQEAEFRNCTFRRSTAVDSIGGVLTWWTCNYFPIQFTVEDCVFESNTANHGGAIAFDNLNATTVLFRAKRTLFIGNSATVFGSVLYVTAPLVFADLSAIEDSTFINNTAAYGAIWLKHSNQLRISRCLFQYNSGTAAAAVFIETPPGAVTLLENVRFIHNDGGPAIFKSNSRTNSSFISRNCTFTNNPAGNVVMEGGYWQDSFSTYTLSKSSQLQLSFGAVAQLTAAEFTSSTESRSGAAVHAMTESIFRCFDCVFANNTAGQDGGAIHTEQEATVHIERCQFDHNFAGSGGGALSFSASLAALSVIRSTALRHNYGGNLGVVFAQAAALLLDNVTISANTGEGCPGITLLMGHATIRNSVFQSMSGSLAAFLSMYTSSSATVSATTFTNGFVSNGGAIYLSSLSNLTITQAEFSNIQCNRGGAIAALSSSRVSLVNVTMKKVESQVPGSLLYLSDSSLSITDCEFSSFRYDGVFGYRLSEVVISSSGFTDGEGLLGGAADFAECGKVVIVNSRFRSLKALYGGALRFEVIAEKLPAQVHIDSCSFLENEADIGGAIYSMNHNISISNSFFIQNNATEGGAIYFDCSSKCASSFSECTFMLNSAAIKGGAIAWQGTMPAIQSTTFNNNTAYYGPDLASFPLFVQIDNITHSAATATIAPGQTLDLAISASLRDHYWQVVVTDNSSVASIAASDTNATVYGETKVTASDGRFVFDEFQVYARPNSSVALAVTSASARVGSQLVVLNVRECLPGEFQTADSCMVCSPGTYSFVPSHPCQTCPRNALCLGNFTVIPIHGFWRSGAFSTEIRECPNPAACLGGKADNDPLSLVGRCATGYKGNLCQSCQDGYSRSGKNNCEKCPPKSINATRMTGLSLVLLVLVSVMVWSSLKTAIHPGTLHSPLIRIFVNYLQLIVLVSEFRLNWPASFLQLSKSQESIGLLSEQLYSVDCFLAGEKMNEDTYYRKSIYMVMLPCGLTLGALCFWLIVAAWNRSVAVMKSHCVTTIVILLFLVLPNIVQWLCAMFSCVEIDKGQFWLSTMMDIQCWSPQHYKNLMSVALPGIIVWVIGVPLLCLLLLVKLRRRHDEMWLRLQFGFLINGYLRKCYYWEFVTFCRKVAIICVSQFINTSVPIQALTLQFVLLLVLFAQYKVRPFHSALLNSVELRALLVADVTIFCGLYFLTNDISTLAQWFFFVVIVASNILFVAYWGIGLLGHIIYILAQYFRLLQRSVIDKEMENLVNLMSNKSSHQSVIADRTLTDCYREMLMVGLSVNMLRSRKSRSFCYSAYDVVV